MSIKKNQKLRNLDPHLEREKERYKNPLPSREYILQILQQQGIPLSEQVLQKLLDITKKEEELFNRRLTAMMREGQIFRNRKGDLCVMEKLDLVKGCLAFAYKDSVNFHLHKMVFSFWEIKFRILLIILLTLNVCCFNFADYFLIKK